MQYTVMHTAYKVVTLSSIMICADIKLYKGLC